MFATMCAAGIVPTISRASPVTGGIKAIPRCADRAGLVRPHISAKCGLAAGVDHASVPTSMYLYALVVFTVASIEVVLKNRLVQFQLVNLQGRGRCIPFGQLPSAG